MTEQVGQQICIRFCVKLEHSSRETILMIQKATAMGHWWLAASSQQCALSCIMSCTGCFVKHQITQLSQPHYRPDLVPCDFWFFPQLKSPLKRDFRPLMGFRKIWQGSWWRLGELCEGPRCLLWRAYLMSWTTTMIQDTRIICTMILVSFIFFNKCLYFSYHMAEYLLDNYRNFT